MVVVCCRFAAVAQKMLGPEVWLHEEGGDFDGVNNPELSGIAFDCFEFSFIFNDEKELVPGELNSGKFE
jgi:hypothetical protein